MLEYISIHTKLFNALKAEYDELAKQNDYLRNENASLKSEHYKDKELARLTDRVKELERNNRNGFPITDSDMADIKDWERKHVETCHGGESSGAIGGRFKFVFLPTSVGTIGTVECSCGAEYTFQGIE